MSNDVKGGWTSGPWAVGRKSLDVYHPHTGYLLCKMGEEAFPDINPAANARLIAAAPELFEALVEAVEALENVNRHVGLLGGERGRLERARAAIAKATGGTPTP